MIEKNGGALTVIDQEISTELIIENFNNNLIIKTADKTFIKKVSIYDVLGKELITKDTLSNDIQLTSNLFKTNTILIVKTQLENGAIIINRIYKN